MKISRLSTHIITSLTWILASGLLIWLAYTAFTQGYIRFNYPSVQQFPIRGIDISHHQGKIDWDKLKKENIQFAYIKASEGGDHKDRLFEQNWKDAQAIGLATGAYHFFTFCREGSIQADNFIATVKKEALQLPPAIDLEFGGNCSSTPQKDVLLAQLRIYIDKVKEAYAQNPVIYATNDSYQRFLAGEKLDNIDIWMRNIYKQPELVDGRKWTFWQFAHQGRLDGIKGIVDLNVFTGSVDEFKELIKPVKNSS